MSQQNDGGINHRIRNTRGPSQNLDYPTVDVCSDTKFYYMGKENPSFTPLRAVQDLTFLNIFALLLLMKPCEDLPCK